MHSHAGLIRALGKTGDRIHGLPASSKSVPSKDGQSFSCNDAASRQATITAPC